MQKFSFDSKGFQVNGADAFMVSGEFHYFRVPREDWRRRMRLFREAGGNCIATYVPWVIHEPSEGDIRFGDVPNRDLQAFLRDAQAEGLQVVLRPGPYQYSELDNAGLPAWLLDNYPDVHARDIEGRVINPHSISYLHPILLEKARVYYRAFAEQVRPFMMENGGPVCMLQVDNELTGIHIWYGSLDYHPLTMGFGKEGGRYPVWLEKKYGCIETLNAAYGAQYARFTDVQPIAQADPSDVCSCRKVKDYKDFYCGTIAEYAALLASWLREDGLHGPICHNSANPTMNCLFPETVAAMGEGFLLGSDHYYTLNPGWPQNNPTPQYALRVMMSCDTMRALGMPPSVLEMPGGSPSDTPPILPEDLLCCYMTNLALGAKGVNYYVYTGGPNFEDTGETCDIYDYNAHVRADGSLNATYASLKAHGQFMAANGWLQRAHRAASVQVGFSWNTLRSDEYDSHGMASGGAQTGRFLERGVLYTLMCSSYSPEMKLLTGELDTERPLIVPCPSMMSAEAQKAVIDFVCRGGKALLLPVLPDADEDLQPCTLLKDLLGAQFRYKQHIGPALEIDGVGRVFGMRDCTVCETLPEGAKVFAKDARTGRIVGFEREIGAGKLMWFGGAWEMSTFDQARMMERFCEMLGGRKCVSSSNRNIFTSLWTNDEGRRMLFAMNLYSSPQTTHLHVYEGGEADAGQLDLKPMEVRVIEM
ncbi:MAG: beta-galactosidase [Clostridia bacterium]|nr:beta-galactosidase [Clostridia bacterium]